MRLRKSKVLAAPALLLLALSGLSPLSTSAHAREGEPTLNEIARARADVADAEALLANALKAQESDRAMVRTQAESIAKAQTALDTARQRLSAADARLRAAERDQARLVAPLHKKQEQLRKQLQQAQRDGADAATIADLTAALEIVDGTIRSQSAQGDALKNARAARADAVADCKRELKNIADAETHVQSKMEGLIQRTRTIAGHARKAKELRAEFRRLLARQAPAWLQSCVVKRGAKTVYSAKWDEESGAEQELAELITRYEDAIPAIADEMIAQQRYRKGLIGGLVASNARIQEILEEYQDAIDDELAAKTAMEVGVFLTKVGLALAGGPAGAGLAAALTTVIGGAVEIGSDKAVRWVVGHLVHGPASDAAAAGTDIFVATAEPILSNEVGHRIVDMLGEEIFKKASPGSWRNALAARMAQKGVNPMFDPKTLGPEVIKGIGWNLLKVAGGHLIDATLGDARRKLWQSFLVEDATFLMLNNLLESSRSREYSMVRLLDRCRKDLTGLLKKRDDQPDERELRVKTDELLSTAEHERVDIDLRFVGTVVSCQVRVGEVEITGQLASEDRVSRWIGRVDAKALSDQEMSELRIHVDAKDELGRGLDANPMTPVATNTVSRKFSWVGFESVGSITTRSSSGTGGPDEWHRLRTRHGAGVSVLILIDCSTSMKDNDRLVNVQKAAAAALKRLGEDDEVGLMTFYAGRISVLVPLTKETERVRRAIAGLKARGGTPLAEAIRRGGRYLATAGAHEVKTLLLFSDGGESEGGDPVGAVAGLRDAGVSVR